MISAYPPVQLRKAANSISRNGIVASSRMRVSANRRTAIRDRTACGRQRAQRTYRVFDRVCFLAPPVRGVSLLGVPIAPLISSIHESASTYDKKHCK